MDWQPTNRLEHPKFTIGGFHHVLWYSIQEPITAYKYHWKEDHDLMAVWRFDVPVEAE